MKGEEGNEEEMEQEGQEIRQKGNKKQEFERKSNRT
jgi:hypothetical protein